ncbi:undecaprenyl/decaprenyl-phosphate alpha-N-acetylglucosaminyl 1-phosphate transferase [bacterium]|nr:MAG: undecaprenyl/decaprenyl-phosphate alpha-N-acetylglucosaminyl 1-phosphate transferase [bacterium]
MIDLPAELRKLTDSTKARRIHKTLTIRSGGISITVAFLLLYLLFFNDISTISTNTYFTILIGLIILTVLGILDDKFEIKGKYQLIVQLFVVSIVVLGGVQISEIDKGLPGIVILPDYIAKFVSVAWIMILINAINWVDGIDGLSTGIVSIAAFIISILNLQQGNVDVAILSMMLSGATSGYIPWNFPPNKGTFVGGTAINFGYLLGVISILGSTKSASSMLILLLPILDMIWVIINRINKHEILNPIKLLGISDKTHLHHRLLDLGLSVRQVTLIEYMIISIIGAILVYTSEASKTTALLSIGIIILGIFLLISFTNNHKRKNEK